MTKENAVKRKCMCRHTKTNIEQGFFCLIFLLPIVGCSFLLIFELRSNAILLMLAYILMNLENTSTKDEYKKCNFQRKTLCKDVKELCNDKPSGFFVENFFSVHPFSIGFCCLCKFRCGFLQLETCIC